MDDQTALAQLKPRPAGVDYFNIEDILATQERVPAKFELPCYRLGFLDPSSTEEHIVEGTKLEIPYWMANELCTRRRHVVSIELPKIYNDSYRQIFKADANVLDLHKMGPHFYKFGVKLLHFEHADSGFVARSLLEVFLKRFRRIMDSAQHSTAHDTNQVKSKLDEIEVKLFDEGQQALKEFLSWQKGIVGKLTMSNAISQQRKRKRADLEE